MLCPLLSVCVRGKKKGFNLNVYRDTEDRTKSASHGAHGDHRENQNQDCRFKPKIIVLCPLLSVCVRGKKMVLKF